MADSEQGPGPGISVDAYVTSGTTVVSNPEATPSGRRGAGDAAGTIAAAVSTHG